LEDIVGRRRLVLYREIGECAAEQRDMRDVRIAALGVRSDSDIAQTLTRAPRCDFFPWVGLGQICVRDLLRFFEVAQGDREPGKEIALVCLERATGERRSREAGKQESLVGSRKGENRL
jgi:hypothetical protein